MKLILQTANIVGDEKNCLYPNRAEVTNAEELQEAVKMDHVCAEYDNDYRSKENFRQSNVLVMDCDNDHTENPAEWITPEKLDEMMPDISYAIAFSRHHMLEKNGKAPRPKFHVYFEIEPTQDADYYAALKEAIYRKYTFFDDNALDAARFIFGADVGDAIWHEGWLTIDSEVEIGTPIERNDTGRVGNVIIAGTRNKTMSKFAGRVIIRYGNTDKAHQIFMDEAAKCEPPLGDEELATIWASAVRWYEKKISKQDGYVPPDQYNTQEFMSLKPGDYSDIGEAKVLAREYGDELRFTDSTDLIRYNGIYWQESKQLAIGAMMEFLDLQLQDAKDQVAATKQALLDSGVSQEDVAAGGKTLSKAVSGDDQLKLLMAYMSALQYYAFVMKHRDYKYVMSSLNQAKPLVLMDINQLDVNPYLLNTPEATYDLRRGLDGAQEHDPLDYLTKCTNASPGDAGKDLWLDTVSRVFCNDPELIDYVQTIVGMAVVGKVFSEALIISYGDGANGKSTFWNTLARVLGNYSGMMENVADAHHLNKDFRVLVNPTGRFVTGGSFADTGLTGRKIMCDTYGGACRHGGGAFSGKDPTKVDRSGAYMARKIAKDILRHGFARRCEVQLAYAIGIEEPVSVYVNTFHTGKVTAAYLVGWIRKHYDLTPAGIISSLGLRDVNYNNTATLGHFWHQWMPWEE